MGLPGSCFLGHPLNWPPSRVQLPERIRCESLDCYSVDTLNLTDILSVLQYAMLVARNESPVVQQAIALAISMQQGVPSSAAEAAAIEAKKRRITKLLVEDPVADDEDLSEAAPG